MMPEIIPDPEHWNDDDEGMSRSEAAEHARYVNMLPYSKHAVHPDHDFDDLPATENDAVIITETEIIQVLGQNDTAQPAGIGTVLAARMQELKQRIRELEAHNRQLNHLNEAQKSLIKTLQTINATFTPPAQDAPDLATVQAERDALIAELERAKIALLTIASYSKDTRTWAEIVAALEEEANRLQTLHLLMADESGK